MPSPSTPSPDVLPSGDGEELENKPKNWLRSTSLRFRKANLFKIASAVMFLAMVGYIIFILVRDGGKLLEQQIHFKPAFLVLSFIIECSGLLIAIPVWRNILSSYGVRQSPHDDVRIYCYSALALVLPGGIWSIVSRSALYQRLGERSVSVATASLVETLVSGVASAGLYFLTTTLHPEISLWKNPGVGVIFFVLILLLLRPNIFNRMVNWALKRANRKEFYPEVGFGFWKTATWVGLEVFVLVIGGLAVFTLLASMTNVSDSMLIPVIATWAAGSAAGSFFFWLPGTPVLRDGAMILILTPGLSLPVAVASVLLIRLWSLASLLLLAGLVWVIFDLPVWLKKRPKTIISTPNGGKDHLDSGR
jgi:hypothetical protein